MKHLIKYSGVVVALGLSGFLLYDGFVAQDVHYTHKLGFVGLLALFVVFIILWRWLNDKIKIRLQSMDTASELGVVGQTSLLWKTVLNFLGLITPLVLVGAMFYYVGTYFQEIGDTILKISLVTLIPMITYYFGEYYNNNQINALKVAEKEALIKGVANEVRKTVDYK